MSNEPPSPAIPGNPGSRSDETASYERDAVAAAIDAPRAKRSRGIPLLIAVALVVIAGAVGAGYVLSRGDEAAAERIGFEAVGNRGADPFAAAVQVTEVKDLPAARAKVDVTNASAGAVSGTTPDLYGGLPDELTCDVDALAKELSEPVRGAVWAKVLGVRQGGNAAYLHTLTPVILTVDTWVTGHDYIDGAAQPRQLVLQRGTSVLIDAGGVPKVKCLTGSPLLPPRESADATLAKVTEAPWTGFDADAVATVRPGAEVSKFDVTNLDNGDRYEIPVGGSITPKGVVLDSNGLGVVSFGDPREKVVSTLTALMGRPDQQRSRSYGSDCRTVTIWWGWTDVNGDTLIAEFDASTGDFLHYEYTNSGPDPTPLYTLATPEGLTTGESGAEVLAAYPGATKSATANGVTEYALDDTFVAALRRGSRHGVPNPYVETIRAGSIPCADG